MFDIDQALAQAVESDSSDLHLKAAAPPVLRRHGGLEPISGQEPLSAEQTEAALRHIAPAHSLEEFGEVGEADFSYAIPGLARFRVNAYRQRGSVSIALRVIPFEIRSIEELGMPPAVARLADEQRGIVLVTGTTGSGKSTTLAAMIDHINTTQNRHILTLEDPIEYLHSDKRAIVNQREVGSDTESFNRAMRRVLRQDPDVILIGEMRDEETVRTALSAAETGHLVLSTVHTLDATETVNRIIDFFPPHLQHQARMMLAATLRGAIAQRLVPDITGNARLAIAEIMIATGRIKDLILNPEETGRITEVISEGDYYGMQTFDQALLRYVTEGRVAEDVAMRMATSPHDFKLMLGAVGSAPAGGSSAPAPESPADPDAPAPPPPGNMSPQDPQTLPDREAPAPAMPGNMQPPAPQAPAGNGAPVPPPPASMPPPASPPPPSGVGQFGGGS